MPHDPDPSFPAAAASEAERLAVAEAYRAVGPELGEKLDLAVELAANLFRAPVAFVSLLTEGWQHLVVRRGTGLEETARDVSFCDHTIRQDRVFVVPDALADPRFADSPLVAGGPRIRFYAGAPLVSPIGGQRIGALCIIDSVPRPPFGEEEKRLLSGLAALVMDRMETRRLENARRDGLARFDRISAALPSAVVCADDRGRVTHWNAAAERLFGWSAVEAIGTPADRILPPSDRPSHAARILRMAEAPGETEGRTIEATAQRRDGGVFVAELTLACWQESGGRTAFATVVRDITQRRQAERRLQHLAHHDPLTGLANRVLLVEALQRSPVTGPSSLIVLDLDGLKHVNDAFGHEAGDALLQEMAGRLEHRLDRRGLLARLGGDEFAVLLRGDEAAAAAVAEELREAVAEEGFRLRGRTFPVCASSGHATAEGGETGTLMANADLALHRAKLRGGGAGVAYEPSMRAEYQARRTLEEELRRAVRAGEFVLHYQPQVRLSDGRLTGVEALLRWRHPVRGMLAPAAFLPVLEELPLAAAVGQWAIEEACRQAAQWRAAGPELRVGVNLFAEQLHQDGLDGRVEAALARHGLPAGALELELTETIVLRRTEEKLEPLRHLLARGVGIAFDDFGTGHASLSTLKRVPATRLKIDRSFVTEVETDRHDAAIVDAVLALGRSMGLEVIAEGIETEAQAALLRARGCELGQGYLYGRPMPPEELTALALARGTA